MLKVGDDIELSASDLVGHLNCRYLTDLDLAVANGQLEKPKHRDPFLKLLQERGAIHEKAFLDHLKSEGYQVFESKGWHRSSVGRSNNHRHARARQIIWCIPEAAIASRIGRCAATLRLGTFLCCNHAQNLMIRKSRRTRTN